MVVRLQRCRTFHPWSLQILHSVSKALHIHVLFFPPYYLLNLFSENQYFISDAGGGGIENNISGCLIESLECSHFKIIFGQESQEPYPTTKISGASLSFQFIRKVSNVTSICFSVWSCWIETWATGTYKDSGIRYLMKWQFDTICRTETSILQTLQKRFPQVNMDPW